MKGKKPKIYLVSSPAIKKCYNTVSVYLLDETTHSFNLNEWDMYEGGDWIELRKRDKTTMECFYVSNIVRMLFDRSKENKSSSPLQPVA